jgi:hypothetical protein
LPSSEYAAVRVSLLFFLIFFRPGFNPFGNFPVVVVITCSSFLYEASDLAAWLELDIHFHHGALHYLDLA